ncbi:MAG: TIR domain-containing protein [Novosphingobium sp.]|uniref:TIR domain-containing protein n=1 Tax=Novosphingobium sp. TaxID=1874826 RepID=UPI003C7D1BA3
MSQIFLSYNREDQPVARLFAEGFERAGLSVWWDVTLRSGEAYDEVTENALRRAGAVVVLWSQRSVVSRWVRAEATLADRNKTLVPAMIEACERPIMFELTQTADLSHWQGDDSDPVWRAFVEDVRRFVAGADGVDPRPALLAPAPSPPPAPLRTSKRGRHGEAPSLAVLPFANRSGLAEDDVFSFGMVEDIIDALSQGVNLRVITSSATARFRTGAIPDLPAMARDLGVRYVMEGNVRRAGPVLRVTAQLVEAESGEILWTQRFERPVTELADLQEDLVVEVSAHLHSQVERLEMARVLKKPHDLTAWECVIRASAAFRNITGETLLQALTEAQRAVEIAPDYGLAHAMLADAAATIYMWTQPDDAAQIAGIRASIDTALALEPDNATVLAHVAEAYNYIGRPGDAIVLAQRARQISASCGLAHYVAAVAATLLGRVEEASAHFDEELRAAPGSHTLFASWTWRGSGALRQRDWTAAHKNYDFALQLNPMGTGALIGHMIAAQGLGNSAGVKAWGDKLHEVDPATPLATWQRCMPRWFVNCEHLGELSELLDQAWQASMQQA